MPKVAFKIWRGEKGKGDFKQYDTDITEGMVVLDAVHQIQSEQANVGIVRTEKQMAHAVEAIEGLRKRAEKVGIVGNREYNPGWHTAVDLGNLLICSEAIARSALERKESRGGHFREDFPNKDAAFGSFNLICKKGLDGRLQLRRETIPALRDDLKQVVEENK